MATFWRVLAGIRLGYGLVWSLVYMLGGPGALYVGIVLIVGYHGLTTFQPVNALPWVIVWVLACFGCRFFANLLPLPSARRAAPLPGEKSPPAAVQAVIVVPSCAPEACPDRAGMLARLSPEVRGLIR